MSPLRTAVGIVLLCTAASAAAERPSVRVLSGAPPGRTRAARTPALTMDVVDADLDEILGMMKAQCGIRNIVVDPGVNGKGTFLFREVPCDIGIRTIFRSLGLAAEVHGSSIVRVKR